MAPRGRQSAEARSAFATMTTLERGTRPEPPKDLSPVEAKIWCDVVLQMPVDWFPPETHTILERYCKHVASIKFLDRVIADIENAQKPDMGKWHKAANARSRESQLIGILATKMRLTQQSSYNKANSFVAKKNRAVTVKAPAAPAEPVSPWG